MFVSLHNALFTRILRFITITFWCTVKSAYETEKPFFPTKKKK